MQKHFECPACGKQFTSLYEKAPCPNPEHTYPVPGHRIDNLTRIPFRRGI
jgi:hypothetical protein